jgi:hypothetical protein
MTMLRRALFLTVVAIVVGLAFAADARSWCCYHYGGYRGGYGGGYRYGGYRGGYGGGYHYGGYRYGGYGGGYHYGYYRRW